MYTLVQPDGGWGWMIVLAYALNSVSMVPIMQGSGLIFKDLFPLLDISATQGSTIISCNMAFGMILGLFNGPLLRYFGYRKVAIGSSVLYAISIILTSFSNSFTLILISYGLLASIGITLSMSAFSLALNTYFTTKRGRATGLAITITGLGSIFMPPVTTFLLNYYGPQGTILLLGSYTLHSIIGALLLHPVKWHMKKLPIVEDKDKEKNTEDFKNEHHVEMPNEVSEDEDTFHDAPMMDEYLMNRKLTISSIDHDVEVASIYGFETPLSRQLSETARPVSQEMNVDGWTWVNSHEASNQIRSRLNYHWWSSGKSLDTIHLGSSLKIFDEGPAYQALSKHGSFASTNKVFKTSCQSILENDIIQQKNEINHTKVDQQNGNVSEKTNKPKKKSRISRILKWFVKFYDLNLLRDPIYVNIMLGMSIAIFAEINFSMLTPFILSDRGLSTNQIATTMSVIATVDLIFRSIAPYLGEWLNRTPRTMYLISLILLVIARTSLIFTHSFETVIAVAVGLGVAKGVRSVYMSLVIPSYVPLQRLPYASAIQMVVNGFFMISAGPCLGIIRDAVGSYTPCIVIINCVTMVTIVIWLTELVIVRRTKRRSKEMEEKVVEQKSSKN